MNVYRKCPVAASIGSGHGDNHGLSAKVTRAIGSGLRSAIARATRKADD